jgi:methionyl-tRNA synthetase
LGYFCIDTVLNTPESILEKAPIVFNRVVTLKDTWASSKDEVTDVNLKKVHNNDKNIVVIPDVQKIEMRVGLIISAEKHPDADTLYVEKIDCGDPTGPRTIISGLAKFIKLEDLIGKKVVVVCNLKPSKMRGIMSEGMVLAASIGSDDDEKVEILEPPAEASVGELIEIEGYPKFESDGEAKSKSFIETWKRVAALLVTDANRQATYQNMGENEVIEARKLFTSAGPCFVSSLSSAAIR